MNSLHQLRGAIESLSSHELDSQKRYLLTLVESLAPFHPAGTGDGTHGRLSPREREVMQLVVAGLLNKQIADRMEISIKTVKVHRSRVMEKMEVRSVAALVHLCELAGITPPVEAPRR